MFAPLALAVFLVVLFIVVSGSLGGGGDGDVIDTGAPANATKNKSKGTDTATAPVTPKKDSYTVKEGDTLDGIATKTGVPVEQIEELNPSIDPRALTPGTKLALTEE